MLNVDKKWFARSLVIFTVIVVALLLATTVFAQGPAGQDPPTGPRQGPPQGPPMGPSEGPPMGPTQGPPMGMPGMMDGPEKYGGGCSVISGMVWYDGNGNMKFEPNERRPTRGEHAMDGAVVVLKAVPMMGPFPGGPEMMPDYGHFPVFAPYFFASTTARDGGYYKFECVPPGLYVLEVTPPPSHVIDKLSVKNNPTKPFFVMGGEKKVISFGFKVDLPFPGAELNDPPRLNP